MRNAFSYGDDCDDVYAFSGFHQMLMRSLMSVISSSCPSLSLTETKATFSSCHAASYDGPLRPTSSCVAAGVYGWDSGFCECALSSFRLSPQPTLSLKLQRGPYARKQDDWQRLLQVVAFQQVAVVVAVQKRMRFCLTTFMLVKFAPFYAVFHPVSP